MTHLIQRQTIELNLTTAHNALHWQNTIVKLCETAMPDLLQNLFSSLPINGNMLVIDKLELNLGNINEANFEEEFTQRLLTALRQNIEQVAQNNAPAAKLPPEPTASVPMLLQTFLHFLHTGTLPWWEPLLQGFTFREEAILHLLSSNPQLVPTVAQALQSQAARRRLAEQFGTQFWSLVIQLINPNAYQQALPLLPVLPVLPYPLQQAQLFWRLWVALLSENSNTANVTLPQLVASFLQTLPNAGNLFLPQNLHKITAALGLHEQAAAEIQDLAGKTADKDDNGVKLHFEPEEKGIFIQNSGLVLLAPFIPHFFEVCGVAENNILLQPHVAVHLLQLLATGQTQTPEFEMPLNKLLCGISQQTPLPLFADLTNFHTEEATRLLQSVIQHWSVLKNTSIDGLRKSFLQRNGKLNKQPDESWKLQVEQQSYDMLLEHIPWSYSVIGLPWMPQPLWVEWQ